MKQYYHLLTQKQLLGFYSSTLLRAISKSLVRVFIAIHLLKLGYSLHSVIIEFLALKSVIWPIGSIIAERFCTRFGSKLTITLGTILHIIYIAILILCSKWNFHSLVTLGCTSGLSEAIFWTGYHIHVATRSSVEHRGKSIVTIKALVILANSFGVFMGGILGAQSDFNYALVLSAICLVLSNICLLLAPDISEQTTENNEKSFLMSFDVSWLSWRDVLVSMSHGMEQCLMIVWSLYTSLNFFEMKFKIIGLNNGTSTFFSILTHLLFGSFIDKNRRCSLLIGIWMTSFSWIMRLFVMNKWSVVLNDIVFSLSHSLLGSVFAVISYDKGMTTNLHSFIVIQETFNAFGQAFVWILTLYFPSLYYVLLMGPFLTLLHLFLTPANPTKNILNVEDSSSI